MGGSEPRPPGGKTSQHLPKESSGRHRAAVEQRRGRSKETPLKKEPFLLTQDQGNSFVRGFRFSRVKSVTTSEHRVCAHRCQDHGCACRQDQNILRPQFPLIPFSVQCSRACGHQWSWKFCLGGSGSKSQSPSSLHSPKLVGSPAVVSNHICTNHHFLRFLGSVLMHRPGLGSCAKLRK